MIKHKVTSSKERQPVYKKCGCSAAIRAGDLLFVSAQVGCLADGSPEPNFARQVQLAFDNLAAVPSRQISMGLASAFKPHTARYIGVRHPDAAQA